MTSCALGVTWDSQSKPTQDRGWLSRSCQDLKENLTRARETPWEQVLLWLQGSFVDRRQGAVDLFAVLEKLGPGPSVLEIRTTAFVDLVGETDVADFLRQLTGVLEIEPDEALDFGAFRGRLVDVDEEWAAEGVVGSAFDRALVRA